MRNPAKKLRLVALLVLCANLLVAGSGAQQSGQVSLKPHPGRGHLTGVDAVADPFEVKMHEKQLKSLNELRQKRLVTDTDKLLKLATELKAEVERPDKGALSARAMTKADQIEKLAKSVREKMKASP